MTEKKEEEITYYVEPNKEQLKDRLLRHLVVGGLVVGCGIVSVIDTTVIKPYIHIKDFIDRCRS